MPYARRDRRRLKKCARSPGTESAACACRRQRRCNAWRCGWKLARRSRRAAIGQARLQPQVDLPQKKRKVSSWDGIHVGKRLAMCHDSASRSWSNDSAVNLPSAFLSRISTRPSASSSCFWHSRDRATPSSKSFIASSKESCGLSNRRTTSSRRARDRSKSGFFGGSGFLGAGVFTKESLCSFLALSAEVCRAAALLDALNCRPAPAAGLSFPAVGAQNLLEPLKPPLRIVKVRRRVEAAF